MKIETSVNGMGTMTAYWSFGPTGATVRITEDKSTAEMSQFTRMLAKFTDIVPERLIDWKTLSELSYLPDVAAQQIVRLHHEGNL
jgi:hypothetical protein